MPEGIPKESEIEAFGMSRVGGGRNFEPAYHSRIVAGCYLRNYSRDKTVRLFNIEVFEKLQYFDYYLSQQQTYEQLLVDHGFDQSHFFPHIQRCGVFMHTINHPKGFVLDRIARMIALKLTGDTFFLRKQVNAIDTLAGISWPIYPEIGSYLAVPSGYTWLIDNKVKYECLEDFIDGSYRAYDEQELTNKSGFIQGAGANLEAVLDSQR